MKQRYGRSRAPRRSRQPKSNEMADSEVITILLVGELSMQNARELGCVSMLAAGDSQI